MQSEECLFLKLFVEDSEKDYLPYVLSPADESSWIGSVRAGSLNAFNLVLIGERISSHPELVDAIRRKKQVSIDGIGGAGISFLFESAILTGEEPQHETEHLQDAHPGKMETAELGRDLTVKFITPLSLFYLNKTIRDPADFSFHIFQHLLLKRIHGLARSYCGYCGPDPDPPVQGPVETILHNDFGFIEQKAKKEPPNRELKVSPIPKLRKVGSSDGYDIGGFKGTVTFRGNLAALLPLLYLGEKIHMGSYTTQGLGKFKVLP